MIPAPSPNRLRLAATLLLALAPLACQSSPPPTVLATPCASTSPAPRTIAVTGTADLLTAPDEFVMSVGIDSFQPDPQAAKRANDETAGALLRAIQEHGVDAKDARVEQSTLQPRYRVGSSSEIEGYSASRTLVITARSAEVAEQLLADLFKRGANRIDRVSFQSSKILEKRAEARVAAIKAARQKAEALAEALGQKIGKPLKIDESSVSPWWGGPAGNVAIDNETRAAIHETIAGGKIQVSASVSVVFELAEG